MQSEIYSIIGTLSGTLSGTLLGWGLNNLSKRGKLHIYPKWEDEFYHIDKSGFRQASCSEDEAKYYRFFLILEIQNSSAEARIMRDFEIAFYNNKTMLFKDTPIDTALSKRKEISSHSRTQPITISPKSIATISFRDGDQYSDVCFTQVLESNRVFLFFRDHKNKKRKVLIHSQDYSQYFDQGK